MFVQQGIRVAAALRCVLETIELAETLETAVGTLHFFNQAASCGTLSVSRIIRCSHGAVVVATTTMTTTTKRRRK